MIGLLEEDGPTKIQDCSAINYYMETYTFNKWLKQTFGADAQQRLLSYRRQSIIDNIEENLKLSIANYNANTDLNLKLPAISDSDWNQALSNISIITFFQGVKVGLKTYNNYSIVTTAENNEFVSLDSLYFIGDGDEYYHRYGCSSVLNNSVKKAFKNIDFKVQSIYIDDDNEKQYYKHKENNKILKPCYDCIVNMNNSNNSLASSYNTKYLHAIARERYELMVKRKIATDYWNVIN